MLVKLFEALYDQATLLPDAIVGSNGLGICPQSVLQMAVSPCLQGYKLYIAATVSISTLQADL